MLPSNREVAAPSCNALTTGIFRHDISLSFFLSLFLFYLIPDPFTTTPLGPEQSTAIARADKYVGLKESSAGLARNLPRLRGLYESRCVLSPFPLLRSPFVLGLCRQCT